MRIRPATEWDVGPIVKGAILFAAERYPDDVPNAAHMARVIENIIAGPEGRALVMEGPKNEFAGCYLGATIENLITGKPVSVEVLFWVEPKFRGHGRALLRFVEESAKVHGCNLAVLSRPEGAERAGKVFEAWGYVPCERHYRKKL